MAAANADPWLDELEACLRPRLPVTAAELVTFAPPAPDGERVASLEHVVQLFRRAGRAAPFRIVRRGEVELAVAPEVAAVAKPLYENAARQVTAWGLAEVDEVVGRLGAFGVAPSATLARRLLSALPRLRWLDERRTWFSFDDERSPLALAVDKIFSIARTVELDTLAAALGKHHAVVRRAPRAVLARYLTDVAGCLLSDGDVHVSPSRPPATLSATELELVSRLLARGGRATRDELGAPPRADAAARLAWQRLLRRTPLLLEDADGALRAVGRVFREEPLATSRRRRAHV